MYDRVILSVSRRTDIPAFFPNWFMNRLHDGYVMVRNPMNYHQVSKISLSPEMTDCIVFWTKNPNPLMPFIEEIEKKYSFYFQYTLNAYGGDIEQRLPKLTDKIHTMKKLSQLIGKERIVWRYDPILISDKYSVEWHIQAFKHLAETLSPYVDSCVFSFLDFYPKIKDNLAECKIQNLANETVEKIAKELSAIGRDNRLTLKTCAEVVDLDRYGILHNKCIDPDLIHKITGYQIQANKDKNQRQECGCVESIDIGQYNTCSHGCKYCYANAEPAKVLARSRLHDPKSPFLIGGYMQGDKIHDVPQMSWIDEQITIEI